MRINRNLEKYRIAVVAAGVLVACFGVVLIRGSARVGSMSDAQTVRLVDPAYPATIVDKR